MDRRLSRSCHCTARGHRRKATLPAEDLRSRGSSDTHGKTTQEPGRFSSPTRPTSTRSRKTRPVGDVIQAQCWQETQDHGGGRSDTKKSCRSLFLKCCQQAAVSLMPKKHCQETRISEGLHCPTDTRDLGQKVAVQESRPLSALPKAGRSCWVCPGSCSVTWATSL